MDFTIQKYILLLSEFINAEYNISPFSQNEFNFSEKKKQLVLRHDVDKLPQNSLIFARIQSELGIFGTYYFRIFPESFNEKIILEIDSLGHEIGYHYENMDSCKGNIDKAYDEFCLNLETFRKLTPITTACMHGSPRSPFDNRDLWKKYNYRDLGIIGEPYLDINFSQIAYYTDTGRMWDGDKYSIRDKTFINLHNGSPDGASIQSFPRFHSTFQMISAIQNNTFPEKAMITFHPQRWTDKPIPWIKELLLQNAKNVIKKRILSKKELENKDLLQ